jgi:isopenicillin-N epimerase
MFGHSMLKEWPLDAGVTYLNHGTVGSPPRRVLEVQQRLRDQIERQPSRFLLRELSGVRVGVPNDNVSRLREAADAVASFMNVNGQDLVFVDNATSGVNAVLRSFDFREGDELLSLDLAYGAVRNAAEYAARTRGARVRVVDLPDAMAGEESLIQAVEAEIRPQTRLAILDHITSETALILPLAAIASRCHHHGVAVLADGAHAPGAVPVDIEALGVDWYTGNLHKWAWAPRSCGILWVHPSRQSALHHPIVSWGLDQGFVLEFDWPGTRDPTPYLSAPAAIAYMREFGVEAVRSYNHGLAWQAGCAMAAHWNTKLLGLEEMIGTMVSVPLPQSLGSTADEAKALRDALLFQDNIEVQVYARRDRLHVRVSAQIYNEMTDVERLIDAIDRRT